MTASWGLALGGRLLAAEHAGPVAGWQSADCEPGNDSETGQRGELGGILQYRRNPFAYCEEFRYRIDQQLRICPGGSGVCSRR
jgi:hypothetical protein